MFEEFDRLQELLGEMQKELSSRNWEEGTFDRCTRACDFRMQLWDAICAYRDYYSPTTKVTP